MARDGGVVVTTGQQPGLFGGPIYTWSKALGALALADAIEEATGIAAAPVFWAATDDADFAEAASTWVSSTGGARHVTLPPTLDAGRPLAEVSLGDVSEQFALLQEAAGSAVDPGVLDALRLAYNPTATVGSAYLTLLRVILQPLGIAVLDASHPSLLQAERPLLARALDKGDAIARALADRSTELRQAGHSPQVPDVEGLSLVFTRRNGEKVRVALSEAGAVASQASDLRLSPNVLLRPIAERALLPTVAYLAGPGELSYFAQVSAVATTLGEECPLALPRWSCTIIEPHVDALLARLGVTPAELSNGHNVERTLARATIPEDVLATLAELRGDLQTAAQKLRDQVTEGAGLLDARVIDGAVRQMSWRADHLEQRLIGAAKRREGALMRDIETARGALFPGGIRQERALNFVPLLARHGEALMRTMRSAARMHADRLVHGNAFSAPSE